MKREREREKAERETNVGLYLGFHEKGACGLGVFLGQFVDTLLQYII